MSTTYLRADDLSSTRRAASVGPGISLLNANDYNHRLQRPPSYCTLFHEHNFVLTASHPRDAQYPLVLGFLY